MATNLNPHDVHDAVDGVTLETIGLDQIGHRFWAVRRATAPLHRWWLDVEREGLDNVPTDGPVILAANHLSFLDSPLIMYSLQRRVTFLGKAEYLTMPTTRRLFPAAGMIPVDRSGRGVGRSLTMAAERLHDGEVVGIFPEGTRSRDGRLLPGHSGTAHLALKTGAPIVPVGIIGSDTAMAPGSRRPRRGATVTLRFGAPIDLGAYAGRRPIASTKKALTEELMASIAALSGQDRVLVHPQQPAAVVGEPERVVA